MGNYSIVQSRKGQFVEVHRSGCRHLNLSAEIEMEFDDLDGDYFKGMTAVEYITALWDGTLDDGEPHTTWKPRYAPCVRKGT